MVRALAGDSTMTRGLATCTPGSGTCWANRDFVGSRASDRSPLPFSVVPSLDGSCQTVVGSSLYVTVYVLGDARCQLAQSPGSDRHVRDRGPAHRRVRRVGTDPLSPARGLDPVPRRRLLRDE